MLHCFSDFFLMNKITISQQDFETTIFLIIIISLKALFLPKRILRFRSSLTDWFTITPLKIMYLSTKQKVTQHFVWWTFAHCQKLVKRRRSGVKAGCWHHTFIYYVPINRFHAPHFGLKIHRVTQNNTIAVWTEQKKREKWMKRKYLPTTVCTIVNNFTVIHIWT